MLNPYLYLDVQQSILNCNQKDQVQLGSPDIKINVNWVIKINANGVQLKQYNKSTTTQIINQVSLLINYLQTYSSINTCQPKHTIKLILNLITKVNCLSYFYQKVYQQKISQLSSQKNNIKKKQIDIEKLQHQLELLKEEIEDQGFQFNKDAIFEKYADIQQLAEKKKTASENCFHCGVEMKKSVQCQLCAQVFCKDCCSRKRVIPSKQHSDFRLSCQQCHQKYIKFFNNQQFYKEKAIYLAAINQLQKKYQKTRIKYQKKQQQVKQYQQQKRSSKMKQNILKKSLLQQDKRIKQLKQQFEKTVEEKAQRLKQQQQLRKQQLQQQTKRKQIQRIQQQKNRKRQKQQQHQRQLSESRKRQQQLVKRQQQIRKAKQQIQKQRQQLSNSRLKQQEQLKKKISQSQNKKPINPVKDDTKQNIVKVQTQEIKKEQNLEKQSKKQQPVQQKKQQTKQEVDLGEILSNIATNQGNSRSYRPSNNQQLDLDAILTLEKQQKKQVKVVQEQTKPITEKLQQQKPQQSLKQLLKYIKKDDKTKIQSLKKNPQKQKQSSTNKQKSEKSEVQNNQALNNGLKLTMTQIKTMNINDLLSMKIPMNPGGKTQKKQRKNSQPDVNVQNQQNSTTTQNQKMYQSLIEPAIPQQAFMVGFCAPTQQYNGNSQQGDHVNFRQSYGAEVKQDDKDLDDQQKQSYRKDLLMRSSLISSTKKSNQASIVGQKAPQYHDEQQATTGEPQKCTCEIM